MNTNKIIAGHAFVQCSLFTWLFAVAVNEMRRAIPGTAAEWIMWGVIVLGFLGTQYWFFEFCLATYRLGYASPFWLKKNIKYYERTRKHRIAFAAVCHVLNKRVSMRHRVATHDVDKLFMYRFLPVSVACWLHKLIARHHNRNTTNAYTLMEMLIDWECARLTKPEKPLNAYDTLYKYYEDMIDRMEPIMDLCGLAPGGSHYIATEKPAREYVDMYNALLPILGCDGDPLLAIKTVK